MQLLLFVGFYVGQVAYSWSPAIAADRQREAKERAAENMARIEAMPDEAAIPTRSIGRSFENMTARTGDQRKTLAITRPSAANQPRRHV